MKTTSFDPFIIIFRPEMITEAVESGVVKAVKLYPAGATTNSHHGVTSVEKVALILKVCMLYLIHIDYEYLTHDKYRLFSH